MRRQVADGGICWLLSSLSSWVLVISLWVAGQSLKGQVPAASGGGSSENAWMQAPPTSTGIPVGQKIPPFSLPDQNGKTQNFQSIRGPKGAALYFMRSADW